MLHATVEISLRGLTKFRGAVQAGTETTNKILKLWAARYRAFAQRRFNNFSKGGGDWPPLKESTIRGRRKGGGSGNPAILRDTGTLFAALAPVFTGAPGATETIQGFGVTVGIGGPGSYPDGTTIADIASFHQMGGGNLPKREIIVAPDDTTKQGMASDAERHLGGEAKEMIG